MKKIIIFLIFSINFTNLFSQILDDAPLATGDLTSSTITSMDSNEDSDLQIYKMNQVKKEQEDIEQGIIFEANKVSLIERDFKIDGTETLKQFGYDYLLSDNIDSSLSSNNDYILGVGDTLKVYIWGDPVDILELNGQYKFKIDENGSFYFPAIGLVNVLGKSILEVESIITAGLKEKYKHFNLELVLSEFKTFTVSVSGMVNKPGQVRATGLSSIINILSRAGGISKEGSLRNITLKRGNEIKYFDLYDILIKGDSSLTTFLIKEGDSIYVNPIGSVSAVKGAVKRPGIYELKESQTVNDVLKYAAGNLTSTLNRDVVVYELNRTTGEMFPVNSEDLLNYRLNNGSIVDVPSVDIIYSNSVTVNGAVRNPGRFDISSNSTLKSVLESLQYLPDTNMCYGEVVRTAKDKRKEYFTFIPKLVLADFVTFNLENGDSIKFVNYLEKPDIDSNYFRDIVRLRGTVEGSITIGWYDGLELKDVINREMLPVDVDMEYGTIIRRDAKDSNKDIITFNPGNLLHNSESIPVERLDEIVFYPKWEYQPITLSGEVSNNSVLTYFPGITLLDVFRGVDFTSNLEDLRVRVSQNGQVDNIYIYDLLSLGDPKSNIILTPGASVLVSKISQRENRSTVKLLGSINKPGMVNHKQGMTLYDLLSQNGGLRDDAYLKGLVLIRESARKVQQEQLDITLNSMAIELQNMKLQADNASMSQEASASVAAQVEIQESLLALTRERAKSALGRISLDLPETLDKLKNSDANITIEQGDYIFIPHQQNYVLVLGNVYNQISLNYDDKLTVNEYLNKLGGFKKDSGNAYIVHVNGEITSSENAGFFKKSLLKQRLKPGDVIVVPQEVKVPGNIMFADTFERVIDSLYKTSISVLSSYTMLDTLGAF